VQTLCSRICFEGSALDGSSIESCSVVPEEMITPDEGVSDLQTVANNAADSNGL